MFERLILNGFEHATLAVQRRMRPEISEVTKQLYPNLQNHKSVLDYPNIKGTGGKNYFFFHHTFPEDNEDVSKVNREEAQLVAGFTCYMIQQGYNPSSITILSLYTG